MRVTAGDEIQRLTPVDLLSWSDGTVGEHRPVIATCVAGEWRKTKYGPRLLLIVCGHPLNEQPLVFGLLASPFREYWTPKASAAILSRRFGSQDPATWPDSFALPLMIARNVKNPKTGERRDRVWVLPGDLWPESAGGGATTGVGT